MRAGMKLTMGCIAVAVLILLLASCGNSRKEKREARLDQPQDSAIIIEQESVIVEVDSIVPDTMAGRR